jgi:hypothetical protein
VTSYNREAGKRRVFTVEFQSITLAVWIIFLILLKTGSRYWYRPGEMNPRVLLPAFNLLPWLAGWLELKRAVSIGLLTDDQYVTVQKAIVRLLGSLYIVLSVVEYVLY